MNQMLLQYQKIINRLSLEAKVGVLVAIFSFIFMIWYYSFWKSLQVNTSRINSSIEMLKLTIPLLETQLKEITKNLEEKRLQAAKATKGTKGNVSQFVSPQKMNEVLRELLTTKYRLLLLELKNLTPKMGTLPQSNIKIFEHGIVIKFQGDYFSTMSYLKAIEELGWLIFWDRLEYNVIEYPKAEVLLQIHTLSDQGDWLDV
jgi:MSHA biogenesis protein MshJ